MSYQLSPNQKPRQFNQSRFFAVSLPKLIIMSLFSCGLYQLHWIYKNWLCVTRNTGSRLAWWITALNQICYWLILLGAANIEVARMSQIAQDLIGWTIAIGYLAFMYPLLNEIRKEGAKCGFKDTLAAGSLAIMWTSLIILSKFCHLPWSLIVISAAVLPLVAVQKYVNALNVATAPDVDKNNKLSALDWLVIVLFAVLTCAIIKRSSPL